MKILNNEVKKVNDRYIVKGGNVLRGELKISGSKNASLPVIAATLLCDDVVELENCPDIHDVKIMLDILQKLGCKVAYNNSKIIVDSRGLNSCEIPNDLMHEMRSSVIIVGALLGRCGKCKFTYPGGCEIGARPINMHLDAFEQLGVSIKEDMGVIECEADKLIGTEIVLDFPSVGATENIMLASCLADGVTHIKNVAREPEIKCLQDFLNSMGADIVGAGSNSIMIKGVKSLHASSFKVIPDRIETGTYLLMAIATRGEILVKDVVPEHVESLIHKMKRMNCKILVSQDTIFAKYNKYIKAVDMKTMPYPGFPTDLQSQFVTTMALAKGTSIVVENIFENRYKYVNELLRMGANITIEGKTAIIQGVDKLNAAKLEAKDLRGGAALIEAALVADGESEITGVKYIERGYEKIAQKLTSVGAIIN